MKAAETPKDMENNPQKPKPENPFAKERTMIRKLFAALLLALTLAACDSSSTETNSNANKPASGIGEASPTPAASPTLEPSPSVKAQLKAGDKVKVAANGSMQNATVISVDETSGRVIVRIEGENKDRSVAIADVTRE